MPVDFRKIFDSVPEEFDKWRFRYCEELFADVIAFSKLDEQKAALEIGPGTGQATEPILEKAVPTWRLRLESTSRRL
jgi:hypothetical protein